ncbi:MAG: ankyrin repeat domain-containing protein [Proteobacteria bacterium]|nr:ankyrin repeat domain-containing protein [Pseudomonadota bacterium]HQR04890.1 ankyrin repeat domain-containing protein [Rhodocyclaceae bacterium]
MKHELFKPLGNHYPHALERAYDRILVRIEQLWETPAIDDYFSDLLIDKRGGRKGFPADVLADIIKLAQYREVATIKQAERREDAVAELARRNIATTGDSLFETIAHGDKELLDLLLRAGVNIHIKDKHGTPPLILALMKGYTVVAQMLLKAGAEVNDRDKRGLTPLLLACGKPVQGYKAIAEALIKKGAFINMRDALGNTPLLLALSGGTVEIAELLIERGADVTATTRDGESALTLARKAGHNSLANLIAVRLEDRARPKPGPSEK